MSDETEGGPPPETKAKVIRLLLRENRELRNQLRKLGGGEPPEASYAAPWYVGLLNWRRWFR